MIEELYFVDKLILIYFNTKKTNDIVDLLQLVKMNYMSLKKRLELLKERRLLVFNYEYMVYFLSDEGFRYLGDEKLETVSLERQYDAKIEKQNSRIYDIYLPKNFDKR